MRADARAAVVVLLAVLGFLGTVHVNVMVPLLPRLQEVFDVRPGALGALMAAGALALAACAPIAGALSDRHGRRRVVLVGVALEGLGLVGQAWAPTFEALVAARVAGAAGGACLLGTTVAYVGDRFPEGERGRVLALMGGVEAAGLVLAVPMGAIAADQLGYRPVLGALGVAVLATWPFAALAMASPPVERPPSATTPWALLRQRVPRSALLALFLEAAVMEGALTMLPVWLEADLGRGAEDVALLFIAFGLALAASHLPAGWIADRLPERGVILVATQVSAAVWLVGAAHGAPSRLQMVGLAVVWGASTAVLTTTWNTLLARLVDDGARGTLMGAAVSAATLGMAAGAAAGGVIFEHAGFTALAVVSGVGMTLSGLIARGLSMAT